MSENNNNHNTVTVHKLPKFWRKANACYKGFLGILTGLNVVLLTLNQSNEVEIPGLYFQIISVLATAAPIVWSKILDTAKEYHEELTPESSVNERSPSVQSLETASNDSTKTTATV